MAATMTSCSSAILAANSILQFVLRILEIFTRTCAGKALIQKKLGTAISELGNSMQAGFHLPAYI